MMLPTEGLTGVEKAGAKLTGVEKAKVLASKTAFVDGTDPNAEKLLLAKGLSSEAVQMIITKAKLAAAKLSAKTLVASKTVVSR